MLSLLWFRILIPLFSHGSYISRLWCNWRPPMFSSLLSNRKRWSGNSRSGSIGFCIVPGTLPFRATHLHRVSNRVSIGTRCEYVIFQCQQRKTVQNRQRILELITAIGLQADSQRGADTCTQFMSYNLFLFVQLTNYYAFIFGVSL